MDKLNIISPFLHPAFIYFPHLKGSTYGYYNLLYDYFLLE